MFVVLANPRAQIPTTLTFPVWRFFGYHPKFLFVGLYVGARPSPTYLGLNLRNLTY